jgi:hypothetical protein
MLGKSLVDRFGGRKVEERDQELAVRIMPKKRKMKLEINKAEND